MPKNDGWHGTRAVDTGWIAVSVPVATFRSNRIKIVALGAILAAMCLACLAISLDVLPNAPMDMFARSLAGIGVPFFGLLTFLWSNQLLDSGAVLEISEEGIKDTRYSSAVIPWSVIDNIRFVETQYMEFLALELPGDVQAKIPRPWHRKFFDFLNPMLGYKGMLISMDGLNGTSGDLIAAINAVAPQRLKKLV